MRRRSVGSDAYNFYLYRAPAHSNTWDPEMVIDLRAGLDAQGNVVGVTRLAGTADAVTTTFTYEPTFNQVASVTDPLGHTTSFGHDGVGNLTTITDALGHQSTLSYNAAGQPLTITTPAGTTQLGYDQGDLATITDAMGNTTHPLHRRRWTADQPHRSLRLAHALRL